MKCETCVAENERSTITALGTTVTLMSWNVYYDEDGERHSHDPNLYREGFLCSRDHQWETETVKPCPAGDYPRAPTEEPTGSPEED